MTVLELKLAARFLSPKTESKKRRALVFMAMLGIFFALTAVTVALGVLKGYQNVYEHAVLNFSAHVIVHNAAGLGESDRIEIEDYLSHQSLVTAFSAYHFHEALVPTKKGMTAVMFKGVDPKNYRNVYPIRFDSTDPQCTTYLGSGLKPELKNANATTLNFIATRLPDGAARTQMMNLNYCGTFESGYYDFDSRFVILPLADLYQKFMLSELVSGIEIRLHDAHQAQAFKSQFVEKFGDRFDVLTWHELNFSLFEALKLDRTVIVSVSFLIVCLACLNIFGFCYLFFVSRKREFLILSALGLSSGSLTRLLALISLFLGAVSVVCGTGFGLIILAYLQHGAGIALDEKVYYVAKIPAEIDLPSTLSLVFVTCLLCLATAWIAGKTVWRKYETSLLAHGANT